MGHFAKGFLLALLLCCVSLGIAQPPPVLPQSAVALDPYNNVAKNRDIYVKDIIYQGSPTGNKVWEEAHVVRSNNDGVFTFNVGLGTKSGTTTLQDLNQVDWGNGPYYLNIKVAVAPSIPAAWWVPADNYIDQGTIQFMSVAYALYAGNATVTNVNTSIQPGPINTFLITDSSGNVMWATPKAAQQVVTNITNLNVSLQSQTGATLVVPALTTATVTVMMPNVNKGDPILVTPQDDYKEWAVYSSWVSAPGAVTIRFANYTDADVTIIGSQYKIVVLKQ